MTWRRTSHAVKQAVKSALLMFLLFTAACASLTSCTTTILPPRDPADPVSVFLLDHGRTPSLVVPAQPNTIVRYAYGDWDYYALRKNDLWHGIVALLWPTQGALGRMELTAPAQRDAVRRGVLVASEHIYELRVAREQADQLRAKLDGVFQSNRESLITNEPYGLNFVHHPKRYTYFYNSNHAVSDWLRQLGCEVKGPTFNSKWRVKDSPEVKPSTTD